MENGLEQQILSWCRARSAKEGRTIGMRELNSGTCLVRYLDSMGSVYVSKYGMPEKPLRFDHSVVLAHGSSWEEVAKALGI